MMVLLQYASLRMFDYKTELKPRLREINMTQKSLAECLGISTKAIRNWIAGTAHPTMSRHEQVMKIIGAHSSEPSQKIDEDINHIPVIRVPILSYVQAGKFTASTEDTDALGHMNLPADLVPKNGYLLEVTGKSMTFDHSDRQMLSDKYMRYSLQEGESIIVDPNDVDKDNLVGKVVVACNADGATVKLLYKDEGRLCLMPLNSMYQDNEDIRHPYEATIIGRAVKVIKIDDL